MAKAGRDWNIGHWLAPPRFLLFMAALATGLAGAVPRFGWRTGTMIAFDGAALVFFAVCLPLFWHRSNRMRDTARRNDANRVTLLLITGVVSLAILAAIASELISGAQRSVADRVLIVGTLAVCWLFSNLVYALHYAHLFYQAKRGGDAGGLAFPDTREPDYSDFLYFAYCLGMTFQTSDVEIKDRRLRRSVTLHCLAAFVFNLGVIAFTINVLGSG